MTLEASRAARETGGIHAQTPPSLVLVLRAALRKAELVFPGLERTIRPRGSADRAQNCAAAAGDLRRSVMGGVATAPAVLILRDRW